MSLVKVAAARPVLVGSSAVLLLVGSVLLSPRAESQENGERLRTEIISLIEDDLSAAYTFTASEGHLVPHFEVIDRIFPEWHHGDPALSRQFWVDAGYQAFLTFYRVDYVRMVNDMMVEVQGKKLIVWSEKEDISGFKELWPFQFWTELGRTNRTNSYLSSSYALRYSMKLVVGESGGWVIAEEQVHDNPGIENNFKNDCQYEQQLKDWGLRNHCTENRELF